MEDKVHKELIKNFPKSAVKQAPKGKFGSYVPHHLYTKRLVDTIAGEYNFTFDEIRGKDNAIVGAKCRLEINGLGVVEEVGDVDTHAINRGITESEILKLAVSDGIKRCCMRFGIGLELWTGDVSEEEHYAGSEVKQVVEKLDTSSKEVKKELKKEDYRERLQKELEHAVKDSKKRGQYKLNAWNLFKQRHETDLSKWSDYELGEFLDLFYAEKVKAEEQEQQEQDIQDTVEEVFGDIKDISKKIYPSCETKNCVIEDNRQKKEDEPNKFGKIPDFTCTNYNNAGGCGKGWWIGNKDLPTEWL